MFYWVEMANRMYCVSMFHMSKESYHLHRPGGTLFHMSNESYHSHRPGSTLFHMSNESYHSHRPGHSETGCTCNKIVPFVFFFVVFFFFFLTGGGGGLGGGVKLLYSNCNK